MKKLLLLHGALGSSVQLEPLADLLKTDFQIYLLNFSGHGGKEIPEEPFSIRMFSDDVLYFIDKNKLEGINVFGYSMGGYVALFIARHYPGKLNRIFATATKFDWNEETSQKEAKNLNAEKIKEKIPGFADELSKRHAPEDWKCVMKKTSEMMTNLGKSPQLSNEDFSLIENEVLISVGDRDKMVPIEETINVYRKLKNGRLLILPDTPHPIEKFNTQMLSYQLKLFINESK